MLSVKDPAQLCAESELTCYHLWLRTSKLVEATSQFCFKNEHRFSIKYKYFPRTFTGSPAKGTQTLNQRCSSVESRYFMVYIIIYICDIYCWLVNQDLVSLSCFKQSWNCPLKFTPSIWKSVRRAWIYKLTKE